MMTGGPSRVYSTQLRTELGLDRCRGKTWYSKKCYQLNLDLDPCIGFQNQKQGGNTSLL